MLMKPILLFQLFNCNSIRGCTPDFAFRIQIVTFNTNIKEKCMCV